MYVMRQINDDGTFGEAFATFTRRDDSIGWVKEFCRGAGYDLLHYEVDDEDNGVDFMLSKGEMMIQWSVDWFPVYTEPAPYGL